MIFDTYWFVFSVSLFLPLYWLARAPKIRLWLLLCFCFLFHMHFAGPAGVVPIVVLALLIDLSLGKLIDRYTYASELWRWVGYNLFFTLWSDGTGPISFRLAEHSPTLINRF